METAQHVMAASVTGTRREEPWDPAGHTAWTSRPRLRHGVPRASRARTADAGSPVSEIEGRQGRFLPGDCPLRAPAPRLPLAGDPGFSRPVDASPGFLPCHHLGPLCVTVPPPPGVTILRPPRPPVRPHMSDLDALRSSGRHPTNCVCDDPLSEVVTSGVLGVGTRHAFGAHATVTGTSHWAASLWPSVSGPVSRAGGGPWPEAGWTVAGGGWGHLCHPGG